MKSISMVASMDEVSKQYAGMRVFDTTYQLKKGIQ